MPAAKPMPDDFATRAVGMSIVAVCREWKIHDRLAHKWFNQAGIRPAFYVRQSGIGKRLDPAPADFVELAKTMHDAALMRHYERGNKTIKRWHREQGTQTIPYLGGIIDRAKPKTTRPKLVQTYNAYSYEAPRDGSYEGRAAEHLRITGYPNVYRCGPGGCFDLKGKFWRAGACILTGEQLVERARAKGWNPDQWQQVAAA